MKTNQQLAIIFLVIGLAIAALAQQPDPLKLKSNVLTLPIVSNVEIGWSKSSEEPPKPKPLTEAEQKEWAAFSQADQQLNQRLFATVEQARQLSASNGEQAIKFLAAIKELLAALDANVLRRELWVEQLRARAKCEACVIEGKELVKPKKEAKP